jgi:hypothetical protein
LREFLEKNISVTKRRNMLAKGTRVRIQKVYNRKTNTWRHDSPSIGTLDTILRTDDKFPGFPYVLEGRKGHWSDAELSVVTPINQEEITPVLQTISKWLERNLNADQQALYKAGFINGNLEPTPAGLEALKFLEWDMHLEKLVVAAKEKIAEVEKKNKKSE